MKEGLTDREGFRPLENHPEENKKTHNNLAKQKKSAIFNRNIKLKHGP
jgi:hypothetical protein